MTDHPFGIDVSKYQGMIDWDAVAAHVPKVQFSGIRSGISWGYKDGWFTRNWVEAKRVGIYRTAYHVLYPKEDVQAQMGNLFQLICDDHGELPVTLDCELDHGASRSQITESILHCAGIIRSRTGRQPIIYSRANWIDAYTYSASLTSFDFWLAQYLNKPIEHPGPPTLPKGIDRMKVIIHQTGDHTPGFGVESKQLDYDRWQFSEAHLHVYAGMGGTTPTPEPEPTHRTYRILASSLRRREQPTTDSRVLGSYPHGTTVEIQSVINNGLERWGKILSDAGYICIDVNYAEEV